MNSLIEILLLSSLKLTLKLTASECSLPECPNLRKIIVIKLIFHKYQYAIAKHTYTLRIYVSIKMTFYSKEIYININSNSKRKTKFIQFIPFPFYVFILRVRTRHCKQRDWISTIYLCLVFTFLLLFFLSWILNKNQVKLKPCIHFTLFRFYWLFFTVTPWNLSRITVSREKKWCFTVTVWCLKYRSPSTFY